MDFSQIWEEDHDLFIRQARRFGLSHVGAEDVVQDLAIEALGRRSRFRDRQHFRNWALHVIKYRAIDWLAGNALITLGEGVDGIPATARASQERSLLDEQVRRFIDQIPHRQKEVLEKLAAGISVAEVGKEMGIGPNTVRSLKRHALAFIREKMARHFEET